MAKGTIIFIFFLCILAALLVGINVGKKIPQQSNNLSFDKAQDKQPTTNNSQPTLSPSPLPSNTPTPDTTTTPASPVISKPKIIGTSVYRDESCGFQLSFPSGYLSQKTENEQSIIFTNPDDPKDALIIVCAKTIPKPSVAAEKIEAVTMDKTAAILYHDLNPDGTPRDEVIIKNPEKGMEIIIAGYGKTFNTALSSFRFIP